jgi:6-phosphogluconate dehydrogenase
MTSVTKTTAKTITNSKQTIMKLGIIGLGKMGGNLALQAIDKNIGVIGKAQSRKPELEKQGVKVVDNYKDFVSYLEQPKIIYLSLPAGPTVDSVIRELLPHLQKGDVIMDGGNSFYLDSIRRENELFENGIYFLDCGTSGGLEAARHGACFMVGGRDDGIKIAEPILKSLAVNDGYVHTGQPGTGHFVKLVHNGIEFGMLQAIGEGVSLLLQGNGFDLDLAQIFKNWSNGSVIRGWLIELMEKGMREQNFNKVESYIEDTGEVNWLVQDAINKEIPIPVISQSIMELFKSRTKDSDTYKAIALMRHGFGGHPFGKDNYIAKERKTSRIQKI